MKILFVLAILIILSLLSMLVYLMRKNHKLLIQLQDSADGRMWHALAFTDELTGLYNRTAYSKHISEIEESDIIKNYGIMLFDIDNFKTINDTQGHLAGDAVLKTVARVLTSVFSSSQYNVYRIGGDEFAVIAKKTTEREIIESMISFRKALGKESEIRLSNGYSIIQKSVDAAFENADEMLYADKASKK